MLSWLVSSRLCSLIRFSSRFIWWWVCGDGWVVKMWLCVVCSVLVNSMLLVIEVCMVCFLVGILLVMCVVCECSCWV